VAIKIIETGGGLDNNQFEQIAKETKIMRGLHHSSLISLYQVFENENFIYLVMEHGGRLELEEMVKSEGKLDEKVACDLFSQLIDGIDFIHQRGIAHRDIKAENILIDIESNQLKIADFGFAKRFNLDEKLKTSCGSPFYAPPEILAGDLYSPEKADIWSMGITLFYITTGELPFYDEDSSILYSKIMFGEFETPKYLTLELKNLLSKIIETNPLKRLSISQIKEHSWMLKNRSSNHQTKIDLANLDESIIEEIVYLGFERELSIQKISKSILSEERLLYLEKFKLRRALQANNIPNSDCESLSIKDSAKTLEYISSDCEHINELEKTPPRRLDSKKEVDTQETFKVPENIVKTSPQSSRLVDDMKDITKPAPSKPVAEKVKGLKLVEKQKNKDLNIRKSIKQMKLLYSRIDDIIYTNSMLKRRAGQLMNSSYGSSEPRNNSNNQQFQQLIGQLSPKSDHPITQIKKKLSFGKMMERLETFSARLANKEMTHSSEHLLNHYLVGGNTPDFRGEIKNEGLRRSRIQAFQSNVEGKSINFEDSIPSRYPSKTPPADLTAEYQRIMDDASENTSPLSTDYRFDFSNKHHPTVIT